MTENENQGKAFQGEQAEIVRLIREDSASARLTRFTALKERFPETDVAALIENAPATDLKKIRGKEDTYYFSDQSMTEAYAVHLFRIEERDPLKLVAETVRDESNLYPRPTDVRVFLGSPFNFSEQYLADVLKQLSLHQEFADIRSCNASNGALYLYSSRYLGDAYAQSLAEWMEVGQKENP
jgi:hypothetical protein